MNPFIAARKITSAGSHPATLRFPPRLHLDDRTDSTSIQRRIERQYPQPRAIGSNVANQTDRTIGICDDEIRIPISVEIAKGYTETS